MSTPDSWRRPDHWKLGDPSRWEKPAPTPTPEPEPRFDWRLVLEAIVLAVVVFGAIVVMSTQ